MIIHSIPYVTEFYDRIYSLYENRELSDIEITKYPSGSAQMWDLEREVYNVATKEKAKVLIADGTFIGNNKAKSNVFYRIWCDIKATKNYNQTCQVDDKLFIAAFNYIGIKYPKELDEKYLLLPEHKAKILYQLFLERYCPIFLKINPELYLLNLDANIIYGLEQIKNIIKPDAGLIIFPEPENRFLNLTDLEKNEIITDFVSSFFYELSESPLKSSWNMIAELAREAIWHSDIVRFGMGYAWTMRIHSLHIWDINFDVPHLITCKVYFEEDVKLMEAIKCLEIGEVNVDGIEKLYKLLKKARLSMAIDIKDDIEEKWRDEALGKKHDNSTVRRKNCKVTESVFFNLYEVTIYFNRNLLEIAFMKPIENH